MTRATLLLVVAAVVIASTGATRVNECGTGRILDESSLQLRITNCDAPPCKLKKRTKVMIEESFTSPRDITNLKTSVRAMILGIPLPFLGVDGADACGKIYNTNGELVGCPLQRGVKYVYKNQFPILSVYPSVALTVRWALSEDNKDITCFEVPARII